MKNAEETNSASMSTKRLHGSGLVPRTDTRSDAAHISGATRAIPAQSERADRVHESGDPVSPAAQTEQTRDAEANAGNRQGRWLGHNDQLSCLISITDRVAIVLVE